MNTPHSREATGGVLSFTFLDVLMCTMGSLLLILVVVGQRATRDAFALKARRAAATVAGAEASTADARDLATRLSAARDMLANLQTSLAEAGAVRRDEQARLSHSEEHQRRLEHELARLHVTLQQLQAAEQHHAVDEQQAERELTHLEKLLRQERDDLQGLREAAKGPKSYAIVPYRGPNGTLRRPVFIECTREAVTIQPEGIRFTVADFDGPIRSGNPLAAAVRAAREELNARAVVSGEADMPDAYPLLIVRPSGAAAYAAALSAIRSWDAEYGYEFVEADWKLEYPEPDPRLAQTMTHAAELARERQQLLARVAPRRYGTRLGSGNGDGGYGEGSEGTGRPGSGRGSFETLANVGGAGDRIGQHSADGAFGAGEDSPASANVGNSSGSVSGSRGGTGDANFADQFASIPANGSGGSGGSGGRGDHGFSNRLNTESGGSAKSQRGAAQAADLRHATDGGPATDILENKAGGNGANSTSWAQTSTGGSHGGASDSGADGALGGAGGSDSENASGGSSGGTAFSTAGSTSGGGPASASINAGGDPSGQANGASQSGGNAADGRGANWANAAASRRASAITRPIRVIVRPYELLIMPGRAEDQQSAAGAIVSFEQPTERVLDQLAAAVQEITDDWGFAGRAMYWRPTLVLEVARGAEPHARHLAQLLDNSGLDVQLPSSSRTAAQTRQGGVDGAIR